MFGKKADCLIQSNFPDSAEIRRTGLLTSSRIVVGLVIHRNRTQRRRGREERRKSGEGQRVVPSNGCKSQVWVGVQCPRAQSGAKRQNSSSGTNGKQDGRIPRIPDEVEPSATHSHPPFPLPSLSKVMQYFDRLLFSPLIVLSVLETRGSAKSLM
ncbi:unnamed protein product [Pleuronectes platessa]|uniref:Uncharacterized protein n=1 Tax=Pleuronectes platessa TaxID=8262 RepID=A0A9N7VD63_PLEPL|nr:unnamed protein product [Pleuronectes platessa]